MNSSARASALGLAGFGHVPQEEAPQAFLEVVLPWLRKTPGLLSANPAEGQNGQRTRDMDQEGIHDGK